MDNKKNGIPKLRFPGFTGAWEQRKLGEEFKRVNERNNGEFGKDRWISVAKMYFQDPDKVTSNNIDTRTYVMRFGDIAFEGHPNNEFKFGRFVANDIGDGVVSELFPIYRHIRDYDNNYWKYAIHLERIMGPIFAKSITSSGNSSNKLAPKDLLRQSIFLPHLDEQKEIGNFLKKMDSLITLHQRKLEHLQEQKKGLLQKMFPKNGETVPEVRFPGFTDAWEQRKLGKVFNQTLVAINPEIENVELWSLTIEDGLTHKTARYNRQFLVKKEDNFKKVFPGDIVYNPMNMTLGAVGFNYMDIPVAVSGYYVTMQLNKNYDNCYFAVWLKSPIALSLYKRYATGSLTEKQRVQFSTLSTIPAVLPGYKEQQKIGAFFQQLDSLITLHQRKLDHLELMKKGLLQQMFV